MVLLMPFFLTRINLFLFFYMYFIYFPYSLCLFPSFFRFVAERIREGMSYLYKRVRHFWPMLFPKCTRFTGMRDVPIYTVVAPNHTYLYIYIYPALHWHIYISLHSYIYRWIIYTPTLETPTRILHIAENQFLFFQKDLFLIEEK